MINISFSPYVFLRTPALSYVRYSTHPKEVIKLHFFQVAIFFASQSLYNELKRYDFNYELLDKKINITIQKYFNRMCFRPTPFGIFSAFTSLQWDSIANMQPCILSNNSSIYVNPDFQLMASIARKIGKSEVMEIKYYSNTSIYNIKNERRYLTNYFDENQDKTDFLISSYKSDRLLNKILVFCNNGKSKNELLLWLKSLLETDEEIESYINELIDAGLLLSELSPNMAGEKYFDRITNVIIKNNLSVFNNILKYRFLINNIKHEQDINIQSLIEVGSALNCERNLKSLFYVGYEKYSQSLLDIKYQDYIREGLNCLDILTSDTISKSLVNFKRKYIAKFDSQEIPLLVALDREAGVGYEGLETNLSSSSSLLKDIHLDHQSNNINVSWTPVHELFLFKISTNKDDQTIVITDNDLDKLDHKTNLKTPPSLSVLFRIYDNKIWIEQAGGCTATSLLGRFTQFNNHILNATKHVELHERNHNKDIIFAEISCYTDEHAANINSNAGIREYEIPIGVHSTLSRDHIISLSDIIVSIIDDKIILRSKRLNKIIIPRLSSAYNYTRSDLSVYRFLCDLQYQGLKANYGIDIRSLLPGLSFYPRIEYKNCILSPAIWILSNDEINELYQATDKINSFNDLCKRLKITKHFALTEGDNQLFFDCDNKASVDMFIQVINNKKSVVLQETFIDDSALVRDEQGKPYIAQFVAAAVNNDTTYASSIMDHALFTQVKAKRIYIPGDEWVYFKLYLHPAIANNILTKSIKGIIADLRKQMVLKCWYFIRYIDTDNHLRIRVKIDKKDTSKVIHCFERKLKQDVEKGSINELLIDTYKRELERYGANTIEYAEEIFEASSEMVINFIKNTSTGKTPYSEIHLALASTQMMLETLFKSNVEYIHLLKIIYEGMRHEFEDSKLVKLQLDTKYREYAAFINNITTDKGLTISIIGKKELNRYIKTLELLKLKTKLLSVEKLNKLAADLIHMNLNRIFAENQRKQEFVIYYFIYKHYLSAEARKNRGISLLPGTPKGFSINHIDKAIFK